jgi:hypothetical protein
MHIWPMGEWTCKWGRGRCVFNLIYGDAAASRVYVHQFDGLRWAWAVIKAGDAILQIGAEEFQRSPVTAWAKQEDDEAVGGIVHYSIACRAWVPEHFLSYFPSNDDWWTVCWIGKFQHLLQGGIMSICGHQGVDQGDGERYQEDETNNFFCWTNRRATKWACLV